DFYYPVNVNQTHVKKSRLGPPFRQVGLDACPGEYIGLSNDDNYYAPGYLEQMLFAMEDEGAPMACCDMLMSYHGWVHITTGVEPLSQDLGCWIARADLVKSVPWRGEAFVSDTDYFLRLAEAAGRKIAYVRK